MLIPATVMAEACSVRLKRKVRNAETKLFEWRPCSCKVVASEGRLLLHLQTPPDDDDQLEEEDAAAETITIDLATQLLNVIPKKNKTRCDLVFYASATAMTGDVVKEEFMAPSAAHCQQWMAQVQRAQKQAQEQQQRRPDSTSPARPTMAIASVAPLPSPIDVDLNSSSRNSKTSNVSNGAAVSSAESIAAIESSPVSPPKRMSSLELLRSELGPPSSVRESAQVERSGSSFSSSGMSMLPGNVSALGTSASCRVRTQCELVQTCAMDDAEIDTVDSSTGSPVDVNHPVARSMPAPSLVSSVSSVSTPALHTSARRRERPVPVSSPSSPSSSSESELLSRSYRRHKSSLYHSRDFDVSESNEQTSDDDGYTSHFRKQSSRCSEKGLTRGSRRHTRGYSSPSGSLSYAASSSSHKSSPHRLSSQPQREDGDYEGEGESSRTELHILQRVESALRALELENAQAKARERELNQEIQSLRDAARITAAERKHTEQEFRHVRREIESWRRAAHSAEAAATQLQEQLGIAREENQLLASEKLRLKRQNSELRTQVHRLDSLVYGRF